MLWIFVPLILRLHEHDHPSPKPRKPRRKVSRTNIKLFKTIFLCSLLTSQHWHFALALQTGQGTSAMDMDHHWEGGQEYIAAPWKTQQLWTRDCLQGLRPPGNPTCHDTPVPQQFGQFQGRRLPGNSNNDDDHLRTALTITEHGRYLQGVIAQHISYQITAHQIREKISSAARLLQTMPTPLKNDKPPPVVLELDKALFHSSDSCTAPLRSDMPQAHVDNVTQPGFKEGGSQASKEGFGEFRVYVGDDALDDDDGLIVSWPSLPYRNPLEFLDDLPEEFATVLRNYDDATDQHDDYLHIYTDGSAGWFDGDKRSSWAFIVFKSKDSTPNTQNMAFVDWFGNITQEDPISPDWTGALEHSSRSGEAEAIAWAILWSLQRHPPCHIIIHSDATSVLYATTGQWNFPDDDYLLLRVRALYKVLWTLMTDEYVAIKHVQAHSGYAGNEIVDLIAKKICAKQEDSRTPAISLAKWMHGHPPLIEWAWTMVDNLYRDGEVPRYEDRHFKWTMWRRPDMQLQWLPNIPAANCVTKDTSQLCCTIASYNVGSLKEAAKSAYLRQQLQFYKIAIAALQETRVAYEDAPDSNYMRFIAKSLSGIGGCELWISLTLPYNGDEQHPKIFSAEKFSSIGGWPTITACCLRCGWITFAICHSACAPSRYWTRQGIYVVGQSLKTANRLWTWQTYCVMYWRQCTTCNHDTTCRTPWRTWRWTTSAVLCESSPTTWSFPTIYVSRHPSWPSWNVEIQWCEIRSSYWLHSCTSIMATFRYVQPGASTSGLWYGRTGPPGGDTTTQWRMGWSKSGSTTSKVRSRKNLSGYAWNMEAVLFMLAADTVGGRPINARGSYWSRTS